MGLTEATIEAKVQEVIEAHQTTPIRYYPFVPSAGTLDLYGQGARTFGAPVTIIGRAIHRPTPQVVTVIGEGEVYEIAFLFSRLELIAKFPTGTEGEWLSITGEIEWRNRRYRIEKVAPSGQVGVHFSLMIVLANSIPGHRDV